MLRFAVKFLFILSILCRASFFSFASSETPGEQTETAVLSDSSSHENVESEDKKFNAGETIMNHITDSHEWHFFSVKKSDGSYWEASVPLPVILYNTTHGFSFFCFNKIWEGEEYEGYRLSKEHHIESIDGSLFYDFSITKNVLQLLIAVSLLVWLMLLVAKRYRTPSVVAPRGFQSFIEIVVIFIRDEVAKPMLGDRANKYLPYLLTVFFFIWLNNLFGLIPGSANVTGNIAFTATLALFTFILMMVGSTKYFWKHMFVPTGIPVGVWPILIPIEFISGIIIKPAALMIRLFANMLAGHLIVLSFLSMIFIFAEKSVIAGAGVSLFSIAFSIFIYFLELLVTALQAYIFTILTALFIGDATAKPHHH
ncbi:MAG TPA: ATP synthase F0 subunit A [Bacteroidetes bacterium]|nr:ATP synthase F0 subunit A [Bacteroidota bacterium]